MPDNSELTRISPARQLGRTARGNDFQRDAHRPGTSRPLGGGTAPKVRQACPLLALLLPPQVSNETNHGRERFPRGEGRLRHLHRGLPRGRDHASPVARTEDPRVRGRGPGWVCLLSCLNLYVMLPASLTLQGPETTGSGKRGKISF